ncbi:MAG: outer membrane beta-barrel protein [Bacteroidota bacterium]
MKRTYLILFLVISGLLELSAQRIVSRTNSWRIGIMGSVDYSYRLIGYKTNEDISHELIKQRDNETGLMGYTFGINASKNILNDLGRLNIGLTYASRSFESYHNENFAQMDTLSHSRQEHVLFQFKLFQIPIRLDLYVKNKAKWGLYIPLGVSPSFLIENKVTDTYKYSDGTQIVANLGDASYQYNHFNISATVGIGFDYHISKLLVLWAQPQFEYYIMNLTRNDYYWEKLYALSLNLGIAFKFGNRKLYHI